MPTPPPLPTSIPHDNCHGLTPATGRRREAFAGRCSTRNDLLASSSATAEPVNLSAPTGSATLAARRGDAFGHPHTLLLDGKRALSRHEFCATFGIGLTTFHALVKSGALNVRKVGRRTLVSAAEAERWWASCAMGRGS